MDTHVVVEVGNLVAAESAVAFLESNGIPAYVDNANLGAMYYPATHTYKVRVAAEHEEQAKQLMLDAPLVMGRVEDQSEDAFDIVTRCPKCNSNHIVFRRPLAGIVVLSVLLVAGLAMAYYVGAEVENTAFWLGVLITMLILGNA